jgi:CelD/BcsL family acetyltransferase involved in cellulose biosynthesis
LAALTCEYLESTAALRFHAGEWDDLWLRSEATLPTSRADLVAQWIEQFAPRGRVRTIVVRQAGQMVAALPLFTARAGSLSIGRLPGNAWSPAGELLVDPEADFVAALDRLVTGLRQLRLPLVLFEGASTSTPTWQHFAAALQRQAVPAIVRERFQVEQVDISGKWERYFAGRSRNHRRQIRRGQSKAEAVGTLQLRILDQPSQGEIAKWLRRGLEIEDRGWKGAGRSSVLKAPGLFDFYLTQARQLAGWGQLRLVFLEFQGEPIAFEYGWMSKGVYFSPKVAYDESFGQLSPGQLLRAALIERLHSESTCQTIDYLGPSCRATAGWSTGSYPVSRVILATSPLGRAALAAYEFVRPLVKRFRGKSDRSEPCDVRPACTDEQTIDEIAAEPAAV